MRRTKITAVLVVLVAASGCAVSKKTFGPDGREALSINCSGWAMAWDACYRKAGDTCKEQGYDVLAANGETGSVFTANPQAAFGSSIMNRVLLISCGKSGAKSTPTSQTQSAKPSYVTGVMPGSADCPTRVVSAGGSPIPDEEQCLPPWPPK